MINRRAHQQPRDWRSSSAPYLAYTSDMYEQPEGYQRYAYFYSAWIWPEQSVDWMKSLLLFFDGFALSLPDEIAMHLIDRDPVLAGPLHEMGLMKNFQPDDWLDTISAEQLCAAIEQYVIAAEWDEYKAFPMIGNFHWGEGVAPAAADILTDLMHKRGLIRTTNEYGRELILMQPAIRSLILTLYALTLTSTVHKKSKTRLSIDPVTDVAEMASEFVDPLRPQHNREYIHNTDIYERRAGPLVPAFQSSIIAGDLSSALAKFKVGDFDLSAVPLDEILDFKAQYGAHYRAYAKNVRDFGRMLNESSSDLTRLKLQERFEEINDQADALTRRTRTAFRRKASAAALSFAGATWSLSTGNPIGAALSALATAISLIRDPLTITPYSYLFQIANSQIR
jgi:hypothetical protein